MEQNPTPPIVSIIGRSGAGKTTFLARLVTELKRRGYRVAVLKHHRPKHPGDADFDIPGKDTWRHFQAGADTVIISGLGQMAMYHRFAHEPAPDDLVRLLPEQVDIVLTEGYTSAGQPAIEILRRAHDRQPVATGDRLLALVSDTGITLDVPQFELDDAQGVATLLERRLSLAPADPDTRPSAER